LLRPIDRYIPYRVRLRFPTQESKDAQQELLIVRPVSAEASDGLQRSTAKVGYTSLADFRVFIHITLIVF